MGFDNAQTTLGTSKSLSQYLARVVGNMGEELNGSFGIGGHSYDIENEDIDGIGEAEGNTEDRGMITPVEEAEIMEILRV